MRENKHHRGFLTELKSGREAFSAAWNTTTRCSKPRPLVWREPVVSSDPRVGEVLKLSRRKLKTKTRTDRARRCRTSTTTQALPGRRTDAARRALVVAGGVCALRKEARPSSGRPERGKTSADFGFCPYLDVSSSVARSAVFPRNWATFEVLLRVEFFVRWFG